MKGGEAAVETVKGPDSKETRIERMVNLYQLPLLRLCVMYLRDEEPGEGRGTGNVSQSLSESGRIPRRCIRKDLADAHCDQHLQKLTQVGMVQVY